MKKILLILILGLSLIGCKRTDSSYYYSGFSKELGRKVQFKGKLLNEEKEKSYLDYLIFWGAKAEKIATNIVIIDNEKNYVVDAKHIKNYIYPIYEKGIKINSDNFIAKLGKVKLQNGQIIELPPIKFIKRVHITKVNPVLDALNQDTREDPFQGTIEEYREWKKRNR